MIESLTGRESLARGNKAVRVRLPAGKDKHCKFSINSETMLGFSIKMAAESLTMIRNASVYCGACLQTNILFVKGSRTDDTDSDCFLTTLRRSLAPRLCTNLSLLSTLFILL